MIMRRRLATLLTILLLLFSLCHMQNIKNANASYIEIPTLEEDGHITAYGDDYMEVHDRELGEVIDDQDYITIEQFIDKDIRISRGFLFFDTSSIRGNVVSATLHLYVEEYIGEPNIVIQKGSSGFPHIPLIREDYHYIHYDGDYGHTLITSLGWVTIDITDLSIINTTGITKIILRVMADINADGKADSRGVRIFSSMNRDYAPYLSLETEQGTPPNANDDHYDVECNTTSSLHVTYNDYDDVQYPDGSYDIDIISVTQPQHGIAEIINSTIGGYYDVIAYTPNEGYHGQDSFTYTIRDNDGYTDTATVYVNVKYLNFNLSTYVISIDNAKNNTQYIREIALTNVGELNITSLYIRVSDSEDWTYVSYYAYNNSSLDDKNFTMFYSFDNISWENIQPNSYNLMYEQNITMSDNLQIYLKILTPKKIMTASPQHIHISFKAVYSPPAVG